MTFSDYAEYVLKICAVLVMLWSLFNFMAITFFTRPGLVVFFLGSLVAMTAVSSGTALLAIGFLFSRAVGFSGYTELLWLMVSASLASVILFDMMLEGILLKLLKQTGLDLPRLRMIEALLGGVFLGLALIVAARFLTDTSLSPVAALAAGLISAFVRYYIGLWLDGVLVDDGTQLPGEMD